MLKNFTKSSLLVFLLASLSLTSCYRTILPEPRFIKKPKDPEEPKPVDPKESVEKMLRDDNWKMITKIGQDGMPIEENTLKGYKFNEDGSFYEYVNKDIVDTEPLKGRDFTYSVSDDGKKIEMYGDKTYEVLNLGEIVLELKNSEGNVFIFENIGNPINGTCLNCQ